MKIVGLIAEYNPFHNGHEYHIKKALEITNSDAAIVVMSGDFVQRGAPAIIPKHLRAQMALQSGAALVLELPIFYSTGSAETFALGAVSILEKLGCVDSICFGSECGDLTLLSELANLFVEEPPAYKNYLSTYLKQGFSFPLARNHAVHDYLKSESAANILNQPNNILGIEYLKALHKLKSSIKPYTLQRIVSHYHDQELHQTYSSASAIRNHLKTSQLDELASQLNNENFSILNELYGKRYPIFPNDFSLLLKHRILQETKDSLTQYADVSEELANRIMNHKNEYRNYEQFCERLKTKELTYSRISRALLHILLEIKKTDCHVIEYARILGFQKDYAHLLSKIHTDGDILLVSKLTNHPDLKGLSLDIKASDLYESVVTDKFDTDFHSEYTKQLIISPKSP